MADEIVQAALAEAGDEELGSSLAAGPAVPVDNAGTWPQVLALGRYMTRTEVHTYAFSVAAQVILSLFPFIVLLLTLCEKMFHSEKMANVVVDMMSNFLPSNQEFVIEGGGPVAHGDKGVFAGDSAGDDDWRFSTA